MAQCHTPSVLVIIMSVRVEFLFDGIDKRFPSGLCIEYLIFIPHMPLAVPIPPVFDVEEALKEHEGDLFTAGKNFNIEVTL